MYFFYWCSIKQLNVLLMLCVCGEGIYCLLVLDRHSVFHVHHCTNSYPRFGHYIYRLLKWLWSHWFTISPWHTLSFLSPKVWRCVSLQHIYTICLHACMCLMHRQKLRLLCYLQIREFHKHASTQCKCLRCRQLLVELCKWFISFQCKITMSYGISDNHVVDTCFYNCFS
jgi:hypothetical protein